MNWIVAGMKWIMLVAGLLTCTMLYAAIAPEDALQATFGETLEGPVAEIVVRNWGVLIALIGAMLIYGAFNVDARPLILTVAGPGKLTFIALVLTIGQRFSVIRPVSPLPATCCKSCYLRPISSLPAT